jgi:hypothetical protein
VFIKTILLFILNQHSILNKNLQLHLKHKIMSSNYLKQTLSGFCLIHKSYLKIFCKNIFGFLNIEGTFALSKKKVKRSLLYLNDLVAQLVEHIPFKDGVLGSNPSQVTFSFIGQTIKVRYPDREVYNTLRCAD